MSTRVRVVLVVLVVLAGLTVLSFAAGLLNQPSDLSVIVGLVVIGAIFIGLPYVLQRIWKGRPHA